MPIRTRKQVSQDAFRSLYAQLNPSQKKAVDTIEGPMMVLAGPGTGKTQVIAMRIAHILQKTDAQPHNILALTFTEAGVKAMRERLISIIGEAAYSVQVSTFHSFCSDIIQEYPQYLSFPRDAEPLSDLERHTIIEKILLNNTFESIKPANSPLFYVKSCLEAIIDLKREGVTPQDFRKLLEHSEVDDSDSKMTKAQLLTHQTMNARRKELLQVYTEYQNQLVASGKYDYEDMIAVAIKVFEEDEAALRTVQERLQYMLVDEFQDTNTAQSRVLSLLASYWEDEANLCVVGDADQSLYRFQGASAENSLAFLKQYPNAAIVTLDTSYRSGQNLLDAAASLIDRNTLSNAEILRSTGTAKKTFVLRSAQSYDTPVYAAQFSSDLLETAFVAEQVQKLIKDGVNPSQIAVLYRVNADGTAFEDAFAKWGIPFEIEKGADVLNTSVVTQFLTLCEAIVAFRKETNEIPLFTVMNYSWMNLNDLDVLKLSRAASVKRSSIVKLLLKDELQNIGLEEPKKIRAFVSKMRGWSLLDQQTTLPEWFEKVLSESGLLAWMMDSPQSVEHMNRINSFFREVKAASRTDHSIKLEQFLQMIESMREHNITIHEEDLDVRRNAVSLMTAHGAKGLEWEHVFLVRVLDKKWGNNTRPKHITLPEGMLKFVRPDEKERNEDERRVFYVALTRAKKSVTISSAQRAVNGNKVRDLIRSLFIEELPKKNVSFVDTTEFEKTAVHHLQTLITPPPQLQIRATEREWLSSLIEDFILSPTALNTYLTCAYKFKLQNLVKVPRAKETYLSFGTAIHKALEMMYRNMMDAEGKIASKEKVIAQFEIALKKEVMAESDEANYLQKGRKVLSAYYDYYAETAKKPLFIESVFGSNAAPIALEDIRLSGKMDKIEWIDPAKKTVRVIDYKTGRPKTRGEIEGLTATSNGDNKRQVLFYKLLSELDPKFGLRVEQVVLDFVEQDQSKKFRQEFFTPTHEEIEQLRATIVESMTHIRAQHFERTKDYRNCTDCPFKDHCWPEGIPQSKPEQLSLLTSNSESDKRDGRRTTVVPGVQRAAGKKKRTR